MILNSKNNPCGAGVKPDICVFIPGSGSAVRQPFGGAGAPTCTCPDGSTFIPDKEKIREMILSSKNNPCGAGVMPDICVFTPGSGGPVRRPFGGAGAPTCTCPDGSTFTPDKEKIREIVLNSENNPCGTGVKPDSCTFTPASGAPTCTCPDGSTFTPDKEKIREIVLNSKNNPCGAGVKPDSCTFTPASGAPTCTCPDG